MKIPPQYKRPIEHAIGGLGIMAVSALVIWVVVALHITNPLFVTMWVAIMFIGFIVLHVGLWEAAYHHFKASWKEFFPSK